MYDLFSAEDGNKIIIVAFELDDVIIRRYQIRSYIKSSPSHTVFQKIPASCFLDKEEYFEFVRTQLPAGTSSVDDILYFSESSGLFLHNEIIYGENGEMIFLQKPFPLGSFEADIGANISPNIPNGFSILFNANTRQILSYKMPYQCNVDMALLAQQFEELLGEGN